MNRINLDWIGTFLEVARYEHIGRAADALQTDQSTISRKIARLEEELGFPLFERVGRQVRLSVAGRRFATRVERILHDLQDAIDDAESATSEDRGEVHVAFLHTIGATWLPGQLAPFHRAHPSVRFTLTEVTAHEVVRGILAGDYDLGILGPPPRGNADLRSAVLFTERIAVVVPRGHELASHKRCSLRDLQNEALVLTRSSSGLRGIVDEAFSGRGIEKHVAYEGDDFSIIQGLVESGLGISLLPTPLPNSSSRVTVVELVDPVLERTVVVCWDRRRTLPPAVASFLTHLTHEHP